MENLSAKELVRAYNELAEQLGLKPVKRFTDRAVGIKRITALRQQQSVSQKEEVLDNQAIIVPTTTEEEDSEMSTTKKKIIDQFQSRDKTLRQKAVHCLVGSLNRPVLRKELSRTLYGRTAGYEGKLQMVLKGVQVDIEKRKVPVKFVSERTEEGLAYSLKTK